MVDARDSSGSLLEWSLTIISIEPTEEQTTAAYKPLKRGHAKAKRDDLVIDLEYRLQDEQVDKWAKARRVARLINQLHAHIEGLRDCPNEQVRYDTIMAFLDAPHGVVWRE